MKTSLLGTILKNINQYRYKLYWFGWSSESSGADIHNSSHPGSVTPREWEVRATFPSPPSCSLSPKGVVSHLWAKYQGHGVKDIVVFGVNCVVATITLSCILRAKICGLACISGQEVHIREWVFM